MEEDNRESLKNISEKFLESIGKNLERLEFYERNIRNGCYDLMTYIKSENCNLSLIELKIKNIDFMVSEFKIILPNIKKIIPTKKYEELKLKLDNCDKKIFKKVHWHTFDNHITKKIHTIIREVEFRNIQLELSSLRGEIIESLSHILYNQIKKDGGIER